MRKLIAVAVFLLALPSCARKSELTAEKAQKIIDAVAFKREPIYAEVPQRVWWNERAPKDDFDEKSVRTLRNLEAAGLVTVTGGEKDDGSAEYIAKVTQKGFPILGTAPSYRGPVYRGRICEKVYDRLRNFQRHPTEESTGHAELMWHYANPTALYPMFETKINKPLDTPFASLVSFYFKDHQWRFSVTVPKTDAAATESQLPPQ